MFYSDSVMNSSKVDKIIKIKTNSKVKTDRFEDMIILMNSIFYDIQVFN